MLLRATSYSSKDPTSSIPLYNTCSVDLQEESEYRFQYANSFDYTTTAPPENNFIFDTYEAQAWVDSEEYYEQFIQAKTDLADEDEDDDETGDEEDDQQSGRRLRPLELVFSSKIEKGTVDLTFSS